MADEEKDFSAKYKGAIIFLALLLVITVVLVLVYLMLKRGLSCICCGCSPCCGKKKADEEEGLYDGEFEDEELLDDELPANGDIPHDEEGNLLMEAEEAPPEMPEIVVTEATFKPESKSKKSQFSGMFKKLKKVKGRVRFSSSSEKVAITTEEPQSYGSTMGLQLLHRTDSMESFMSAMSTATTHIEEFGDELSPSRIQVFVQYDPKRWKLIVGIKQAECLVSTNKETMYWQTHMTLLPFKKHRFKTKYKSTTTPIFNQNFEIENIAQQALTQLSVRYRVYGRAGRTGRKKLAGETEIELSHICQLEDKIIKDWRVLRRAGGRAVRHESEV